MLDYLEPTRLVLAFFVGYFLCLSGSLCQIVTNNDLASPSTLGMSGFGVLVVIVTQFMIIFMSPFLALPASLLSFIIFSCSLLIITSLVRLKKKTFQLWTARTAKSYILIGIVFNLFVGALFSVIQFLFVGLNYEFPTQLWFGNFRYYHSGSIYILLALFVFTLFHLNRMKSELEVLNIGEGFAAGLGFNVPSLQKKALLFSLVLTGSTICFFGVFSFLGLIFPHILRSFNFFKSSISKELMIGPFICGMLLSVIDLLCYNFTFDGVELPVGMVSSVFGALLMMLIMAKPQKTSRI